VSDFERVIGLDRPLDDRPAGAWRRRSRLDEWWSRMMATEQRRRAWRWGVPIAVTLIAAVTRLWNLGHPGILVFDETFYVKDAWSLWNLGYSSTWPDDANASFAAGNPDTFTQTGSYVVHPPLGKWLIGLGMAVVGAGNPVGWRIATAIVGILAVLLLFLIARKLFDSTLIGGIAALLMAVDGNAIVMSRVALLDNFLMFFVLLAFGAVLLDREWAARRLAEWIGRNTGDLLWGPVLWWRPWLIGAGLALGLASAVKWNGLYFLAFFALYSLVSDVLARRRAGIEFWTMTVPLQGAASFLLTVPIAIAVHMSTWISWFTTTGGYDRTWAEAPGNAATGILSWVPLPLQSWVHYQQAVYAYHVGEVRPHGYQANPLTWLFMVRPTSMFYEGAERGENGCTVDLCGSSITGLANPLIWFAATAALGFLLYRLVRLRDWRAGLILTGVAAGYLPWLMYLNRTVFQFYTNAFEPFLVLGLAYAISALLGHRDDHPERRTAGLRAVGLYLVLVLLASAFFWPLWTGMQLDYQYLRAHWWLPSWR
jgi:dolichyl-phosphate-mannose--protein O-mannosyl transferase